MDASAELWVITSFFNPAGYQRRLENYHAFRSRLGAPLVCVEQSCTGHFELAPGDADILLQVTGDCMWQKERLLNIAIAKLPPACQAVAWIDCDIIFEHADWPSRTLAALEHDPLVHLFEWRIDLAAEGKPEAPTSGPIVRRAESLIARARRGVASDPEYWDANAPNNSLSSLGLAWAASRVLLETHSLYDACILGSGDRVILCGGCGRFDDAARAIGMNARQRAHFLQWAEAFHRAVGGRVGYLPGKAYHLWHGDFCNRGYSARHEGFAPFEFDPAADLQCNEQGAWRWNSPKSGMHNYVLYYFSSRREDG